MIDWSHGCEPVVRQHIVVGGAEEFTLSARKQVRKEAVAGHPQFCRGMPITGLFKGLTSPLGVPLETMPLKQEPFGDTQY
jgi:hypothetical protein